MSWSTISPTIQAIAEDALTDKQLATWKLELAGWGHRKIGLHLGITRATVRDHLDATHLKLTQHGIRQDASGHYHQEAA